MYYYYFIPCSSVIKSVNFEIHTIKNREGEDEDKEVNISLTSHSFFFTFYIKIIERSNQHKNMVIF